MIKILYTRIDGQLEGPIWNHYLNQLSPILQKEVLKYYKWEDRYSNLFGKLLLKHGLMEYGYQQNCLNNLKYNAYGKPYLDKGIHFNLSHSGKMIICGFSETTEIGTDIEKMNPVDIPEFTTVFTKEELNHIQSTENPINEFYRYWTIKESVIKAIGKGMSLPLNEVIVSGMDICTFRDQKFNIRTLNIQTDYFSSFATNCFDEHSIQKIGLNELN